jgi:N-carbamoyl-L-amino-acid hydrolase
MTSTTISFERLMSELESLGRIGEDSSGAMWRLGLSAQEQVAHEWFKSKAETSGLRVRSDAAGNTFARLDGATTGLAPLWVGSHLDTVPSGGKYDGAAGVMIALELARALRESGTTLRHPLDVVVFRAEEPSPFGFSTFGSRALAGRISERELDATDDEGRKVHEALRAIGGDPERLREVQLQTGDVAAYLEVHNEQGPHLDRAALPIAVVTSIAGIRRGRWSVHGEANHSGTTSMAERRDALMGAAEIALALEREAKARDDAVGTIGVLDVVPNAANVVPGCVELGWEMRSRSVDDLNAMEDALDRAAHTIAERRRLVIEEHRRSRSLPAVADDLIVRVIEEAAIARGLSAPRMCSMAGHDASHMAAVTKIGMIFLRSTGGKSHVPEEHSPTESLAAAATVVLDALQRLDRILD